MSLTWSGGRAATELACLALASGAGVPYGFFPNPVSGDSFSVVFDINMDQSRAADVITYLRDGGFLDDRTSSVTVQIVTFNAQLDLFSLVTVKMTFSSPGEIEARVLPSRGCIGGCVP